MTTIPLKIYLIAYLLAPLVTLAQNKSRTEIIVPGVTKLAYHVKDDDSTIKEGYFEESIADVPLTQGNYSNNEKSGGWKYLSPDSMVTFAGNYYHDHKVHKWYYFHRDKIFCVLRFNAEGQPEGDALGFYATGDTAAITPFLNGKRQGLALRFDLQHHISARKHFDDDHLLTDTSFYANGRIHEIHTCQDDKSTIVANMDSLGNPLLSIPPDKVPLYSSGKEGYYPPGFPGGEPTLVAFLARVIRYPKEAAEHDIHGTVFISFMVDKDGYIHDVTVKKSVHPLLDAEAKRVIGSMPRWSPCIQDFVPVAVEMNMPIRFSL